MKLKSHGRSEIFYSGGERGRRSIVMRETAQASPARLPDKGCVEVGTLHWLRDRGRGIKYKGKAIPVTGRGGS
jgi:hypothetical protein